MYSITLSIIIITSAVSLLAFNNRKLMSKMLFSPFDIRRWSQWYRFFSHGLLHNDWMHLFVNMFVLWQFGRLVEHDFVMRFGMAGKIRYLAMYILAIAASSVYSYLKHKDNPHYGALGASGAVSAVLFTSILIDPNSKLSIVFIPFLPMSGLFFGGIYLLYSAYMAKRANDHIGHDAHFWGAVFGFVFPILLRPAYLVEFLHATGIL